MTGIQRPVLVSGTDGVGTKLKLAFLMDKHDTVGIDCVAMCVNDIVCCGARPLFFLDYVAVGKNVPERVAQIVGGVAEGCVEAGCALVGGETAEMPGFYPEDEYDLAGFSVGVVDKSRILDKNTMQEGDVLIALPSSGVHSNGFFAGAQGLSGGKGRTGPPLRRPFPDARRNAAHPHPHLCQTRAGAAQGRGAHPLRQPHHRRRLLREHPAFAGTGHDGPHRARRRQGAAHLRHHRPRGRHPRARHVQHLQHGRGHVPDGGGGGRRPGADSLADAGEDGAYALGEIVRGEGGIELC